MRKVEQILKNAFLILQNKLRKLILKEIIRKQLSHREFKLIIKQPQKIKLIKKDVAEKNNYIQLLINKLNYFSKFFKIAWQILIF